MANMHVERHIAASPDRVWSIITNIERSPEVVSGIDAVEVLEGPEFGIGTTWNETRTMFGKQATEVMRVVAVEPGASYTIESRATGTVYRSTMAVTADGDGSVLSMSFSAEAGSAVSKVFASTIGKLFEGGTRKAIEQDLTDIAREAEQA